MLFGAVAITASVAAAVVVTAACLLKIIEGRPKTYVLSTTVTPSKGADIVIDDVTITESWSEEKEHSSWVRFY